MFSSQTLKNFSYKGINLQSTEIYYANEVRLSYIKIILVEYTDLTI